MKQVFIPRKTTFAKIASLPRLQHPADLYNMPIRQISQQKKQIQGKLQFGAGLYSNKAQENLIKSLIETRNAYRSTKIEEKISIAEQEYNHWKNYLQERIDELPEEYKLREDQKQSFYECYLVTKERNFERFQMNRTMKLLYEFSKHYKVDMAFHPLVLQRIIHPHFGYLNNYHHIRLSFDHVMDFLQELLAVSLIIDQENTLHSSQLLSFVFWKLNSNKPTMTLDQFCSFLEMFKFKVDPDNFASEFDWDLKEKEGEIAGSEIVRFDLWRSIFLSRGL